MEYDLIINNYFGEKTEKLVPLKFFNYNSYKYAKGLMVIENHSVSEIKNIFSCEGSYYLLCERYEVLTFDHLCNSIQIKKTNERNRFVIFNFIELENKRCYEKRILTGSIHVIADTLLVYNESCNN